MRLFGFEISRVKEAPAGLVPPWTSNVGGWFRIGEPFTGAWQRNKDLRRESVVTYHAVYACVTLVAQDISKMPLRLVEQDDDGIWTPKDVPSFSPVLRKPNRYQNRIKFIEQWVVSKLLHGNAYILLGRNRATNVEAMYVLDPCRTKPLVAPNGDVYYEIGADNLAGIGETSVIVPASEIIHDVMVPLYHPLCGVSPLTACGMAAAQGLAIQANGVKFFNNGAQPSGILTAPDAIDNEQAAKFKAEWEKNYTGDNSGRIAVLGGGLKYEAMSMKATDAQLIEQLKWSAETVCSAFHVPPYMIGVGNMPTYNNIEALNAQYYAQCLQSLIENIELSLDEGLGLTEVAGKTYGTEFDLDNLLRMDSKTMAETEKNLAGIKSPNESRARLNLPPVEGGESPMTQQQNYSLAALAKRDAQDDPFGKSASSSASPAPADTPSDAGADNIDPEDDAAASEDLAKTIEMLAGVKEMLALGADVRV